MAGFGWRLWFAPITRLEPPGWGRLFAALEVMPPAKDPLWRGTPLQTVRGKRHGFAMRLRMDVWSQRVTYFLGRSYDLPLQLLLERLLRPGETFIDVGANIGMLTLVGAARVTPSGRVHAVEPNPENVRVLADCLRTNGINHVTVHPVGLSDATGRLTLRLNGDNTGVGSFCAVQTPAGHAYDVDVLRGDDLPSLSHGSVTAIKVDVEGFECRVLRGFSATLGQARPAVVTECVASHLARAGASVEELLDLMTGRGYTGYHLSSTKTRLLPTRLRLTPLAQVPPQTFQGDAENVVWLHPQSPFPGRLGL